MSGQKLTKKFKLFNISRRKLILLGLSAIPLVSLLKFIREKSSKLISGKIIGASFQMAHLIRGAKFPKVRSSEEVDVIIVGGGIAGLSAAHHLQKNNFKNFKILELEKNVGGKSHSGKNNITPYPWGAHYIPFPGEDAVFTRELFEELKIITGYDTKGLPIYNEYFICADPSDRLFIHGRWQEGIIPKEGVPKADQLEIQQFLNTMERFKWEKGSDNKYAFTIPIAMSSKDSKYLSLDKLTIYDYLKSNNWHSQYLYWYVDYCCKDDYGTTIKNTSAYAGIHYFASRKGKASNASADEILTWPEGNGYIVKKLESFLHKNIVKNSLVYNIKKVSNRTFVDSYDPLTKSSKRYIAKSVIFAAPRFVGKKVINDWKKHPPDYLNSFHYSPWMVANITLKDRPAESPENAPLSWDNVNFHSKSLGYIVASHQGLKSKQKETVLTYYMPLCEKDSVSERLKAIVRTHSSWINLIKNDLTKMHPYIEDKITHIDVWVWGHGMIQPRPNFITNYAGNNLSRKFQDIYFAHSDMSGISIFEEAQYQGIMTAKEILNRLSKGKQS